MTRIIPNDGEMFREKVKIVATATRGGNWKHRSMISHLSFELLNTRGSMLICIYIEESRKLRIKTVEIQKLKRSEWYQ